MDTPPPSILPVRLKRETPFKSQLGCTVLILVVVLVVTVVAFYGGRSPGENSWVAYVVSFVFGLAGLLMLWSLVRQLAALGLKETIIEVSSQPLQPGSSAKICAVQPGPAKLKSLRVNLVCLERRRYKAWNAQSKTYSHRMEERILSTENLLDAQHLHVVAGDFWHEVRELSLPANAPKTGTKCEFTIAWQIEVWGVGYRLASFMHPFPVDVFSGERPQEEDDTDEDGL